MLQALLGLLITLPPASGCPGARYEFIQNTAAAVNASHFILCGANGLFGVWMRADGTAGGGAANVAGSVFLLPASVRGDRVTAISDGAKWNVVGVTGVNAGMIIA